MATIEDRKILGQCLGYIPEVRAKLIQHPHLDGAAVEDAVRRELEQPTPNLEYLQALATALVALLPSSHAAFTRLLFASAPKGVYELRFSAFVALNRSDFNELEQDGVEYLLFEYLRGVKSTAAYAAWKAGLVLGEDWLSPRTERLLKEPMKMARYPAGRLGAINGYRFIVQRRKTFTAEEFAPLSAAAHSVSSRKVREWARFHLERLRSMQGGSVASAG
jgi:hypothetical protein